jgi:hypothetical protein
MMAMSQGNMKKSHARQQALPISSAALKSDNSQTDYAPLSNGQLSQEPADSTSQSTIGEINKNIQHFETIRDAHKSMLRLIDTMFDYLQLYADESNKRNDDPHLNLHWQRPTLEKLKLKNTRSWLKTTPDLPTFTGKLYTCDWSLIVKGTNELVTSYIIPSDRVISFNSEPEIYSPYLTIDYKKRDAHYNWQIGKEIITHEYIDDLSKKLLERLLKCARNKEWSKSIFCLQSIEVDLVGPQKNKKLEIFEKLDETASDPEQFLIDLMKTTSEKAKSDEFKIAIELPKQFELKDSVLNEKCEVVSSGQTFEEALKSLPDILVQKLKQLTQEGGEAFSKHDLKGAQDILTLSNQLSEFKSKVEEIRTAFKI